MACTTEVYIIYILCSQLSIINAASNLDVQTIFNTHYKVRILQCILYRNIQSLHNRVRFILFSKGYFIIHSSSHQLISISID